MAIEVMDHHFTRVSEVRPDTKKRVVVGPVLDVLQEIFGCKIEEMRFSVSYNSAGQILLAPELSVPMPEAWLYQNPKALKSVMRGLDQAAAGKISPLKLGDEEEE
jgi:hypothetical protein